MIVNPRSGQQSHDIRLELIKRYFKKFKMNLDIRFTEHSNHATEIAKEASCKNEYDVIIGAGGDGTINEVFSGMMGSNKPLAIMPWGTGNVFARHMNIPFNLKKICRIIRNERTLKIDIAKCNDRYFFLMCSAGFDAYSIKETENTNLKRIFGGLSYVIGGLKAFSKYSFEEIEVEMDNGKKDRGTYVLISNISRYAIYFTVTPKANPIDGLLDIYIFKEAGRWNFLKLAVQVARTAFSKIARTNRTIYLKKQAYHRSKKVRLISKSRVLTQLDGDLSYQLPVNISVIPQAVNFILPGKIVKKYHKLMNDKHI